MTEPFDKFSFGLNLDDPWRYSGMKEPKSIIIPHLIKVDLGEKDMMGKVELAIARALGRKSSTEEEECAALIQAIKSASIDFVRCWFPWRYFDSKDDQHLYPMDMLVDKVTEAGKSIIPVLACGYRRMLPDDIDADKDPSGYIKRAGEHARELVRHYRKKVKVWQIENEPNWWEMHLAGGWREGAVWLEDKFRFELLKMLNDSVHEEDPDAITIINLECDRGLSIDKLRYYSELCDMLGFDFYPNYDRPEPIDAGWAEKADEMAKELGKKVLISETGYPSGPFWLGFSSTKQAEYVMKALLESHNCSNIAGIAIWRYADTAWKSFPPQENHFGLFDELLNPKPAFRILSDTIKHLKG